MRAALARGIQDIDRYVAVEQDVKPPTLDSSIDGKTGRPVSALSNMKHMIVRVLACALAPGDVRLMTGKTDMFQLPKTGRPYILGSDICGIVTEVQDDESHFAVGDKVICRFDEPQPHGMCAEYACVQCHLSEKCPEGIPAIEACTLPASAAAARKVAMDHVSSGDRVLLLGASGGVGTFMCQYAKLMGASFLAATTTQKELALSLGVDRVIDYRNENWWELVDEFGESPFDVVVDLVNGRNWQDGACSGTKVLKKDTKYVQLLSGVETEIDVRGPISLLRLLVGMFTRSSWLYNKLVHPQAPIWIGPQGLELNSGDLKSVLDDVEQKRIRVVLDPSSPFPFTTEGVRNALKLQKSIHAHGKVVVKIADDK